MKRMPIVVVAASIAAFAMAGLAPANAADYPARPITLIVPYPAGGGNDVIARLAAASLKRRYP